MNQSPPSNSPLDRQEGGNHYKIKVIQPLEYAMANNLDPCEFSIVRYASRHREKDGVEALKKIIHYAQLEAWFVYGEVI